MSKFVKIILKTTTNQFLKLKHGKVEKMEQMQQHYNVRSYFRLLLKRLNVIEGLQCAHMHMEVMDNYFYLYLLSKNLIFKRTSPYIILLAFKIFKLIKI